MTENAQAASDQIPSPNIPMPQQATPMAPGPQGMQTQAQPHPSSLEAQLTTALGALEEERNRRSGLDRQNRKYDERIGKIEGQLTGIAESLEKLTIPPQETEEIEQPPGPDLAAELTQLKAEKLRDDLITEMTMAGQPGEGMNLWAFRGNIPLAEDAEGQRAGIQSLIDSLKGIAGEATQQTHEALTHGMTPGSNPPTAGEKSELDEAKELHAKLNDPTYLAQMNQDNPSKLQEELARYDDLTARYGGSVSQGYSMPWVQIPEMNQLLNALQGQVSVLSEKAGMPFPLGG